MTPATTILARAESAGLLLRLTPDGQVVMEGPAPPPGLLAEPTSAATGTPCGAS